MNTHMNKPSTFLLKIYSPIAGLLFSMLLPFSAHAATTLTVSEKTQNPTDSTYYNETTLLDQTTATFQSTITNSGSDRAFKISFYNDYNAAEFSTPQLTGVSADTNGDGTVDVTL